MTFWVLTLWKNALATVMFCYSGRAFTGLKKRQKKKQRWDCVMSVATIRLGCSLFSFFFFEGRELVTDILGSEQSICTVAKTVDNFMIICGSMRLFL